MLLRPGSPMRGVSPAGKPVRGTFLRIEGLHLVKLLSGGREFTVTSASLQPDPSNEITKQS